MCNGNRLCVMHKRFFYGRVDDLSGRQNGIEDGFC